MAIERLPTSKLVSISICAFLAVLLVQSQRAEVRLKDGGKFLVG